MMTGAAGDSASFLSFDIPVNVPEPTAAIFCGIGVLAGLTISLSQWQTGWHRRKKNVESGNQ
jgi:hypothetical protein